MHFWGLTIDVVSAVNVIIAIGLCVDYSVHICHAFLTVSGTKRERAHAALVDMGPAVLNGGLSTLIAFILLLSSDSHVFSSFFKIFMLVVLFGVWHGLILLPVLLSLVGPAAYASARPAQAQTEPEKIPIDSISVKL
jgi:predicted RND superfamily exporter protein